MTGGIGSRLGELTKNTNKALVPINGRATIDYIIDQYPKEVPVVVNLGFLGQSVKDYLEKNHTDRTFEFVWLDKYQGPGASIGYAILQAKENLQCPFLFQGCDTLVMQTLPAPEKNWIGGYFENWQTSTMDTSPYDTISTKDGRVVKFNKRGTPGFDSIYLGLDGVFDYKVYFEILEALYNADPMSEKHHPIQVYNAMLERGVSFLPQHFTTWLDTGNIPALKNTEEVLKNLKK
ncbi:MAG: NTP transferase domain-containing protein [bacterium]|nr:NTP transferase domain-containing protein [bacterium]